MKKQQTDYKKLDMWQQRLKRANAAYSTEYSYMDRRESMYRGNRLTQAITDRGKDFRTNHVRNICQEIVEAQVSSEIPQPKVTAKRKKDEPLAKLIEDMLRNELDRLPFETINDIMSRTVPIQGGAGYLLEWDNTQVSHYEIGDITVSPLHPKLIIPQDGVYTSIEDMDYIILRIPQTKEYIEQNYGVSVTDEFESEPEIKGYADDISTAEDMVTQYIAYYRNKNGGIGKYSWVNDVQIEDIDDYQARRLKRCAKCGAVEPLDNDLTPLPPLDPVAMMTPGQTSNGATFQMDQEFGLEAVIPTSKPKRSNGKKACPYCGSTEWTDSQEDYEEVYNPIKRTDGSIIPGMQSKTEETGEIDLLGNPVIETYHEPTKIPFYKPDIYPVILQKNVSAYGKFLGLSDLDSIADQQNTINRLEQNIIDKQLKSGSYLVLPPDASIATDEERAKVIRVQNAATASMIASYNLAEDIEQDLVYLETVYQEARQIIGITDSYQGRTDKTATSGKAKEFAAAQSAGRLESKRVMKEAAFAQLFEAMFKFKLAYADEPRNILSKTPDGETEYKEFNRYDFLEMDSTGEWVWNDQFLFSCDTSTPLANNREAMWQETRANLQTGAFGDPANLQTLILFWTKMEMLHYPGASETKAILEQQLQQQQMMMQQQQAMQQQMMQQQQNQQLLQQIDAQARADAERDSKAEAKQQNAQAQPTTQGNRASGYF